MILTLVGLAPASPPTPDKIPAIAVMDLDTRGGLSPDEIGTISDRLRGELISTGKFLVIERSQMDDILREQGFQQTGACSDASCIVQVGQLLAVHKMFGGSIGKVGELYSINIKIIDVATGRIEQQLAKDVRCSKEELLTVHMAVMARQVAGLQPSKRPGVRWYVWAGAGVAVAGGVTAVLLLNRKKSSDNPPTTHTLVVEGTLQ